MSSSAVLTSAEALQEVDDLRREILREREARQALEDHLVATARRAGMAEVATNVLHAVGNVLTTVNISATTIAERLKQSEIEHFGHLVRLLESHQHDLPTFIANDPQGRHLPAYLLKAVEVLLQERGAILEELGCLAQGIEHIRAVVAEQQHHARQGAREEELPPRELVEAVIALHRPVFDRFRVVIECDAAPAQPSPHRLARHAVLRILVNLVSNAVAAVQDQPPGRRRIRFHVTEEADQVSFGIIDQGVGMGAEQLASLFQRGFTTRHDGHGFGLHDAALQAAALGGRLEARSDGPGTGATFLLHLPIRRSPCP